ncbi:hypothetical protein SK128_014410 [Halocaridina rubra]|uniref:Uncharacterized protein n=1 Tax=Halocaridina rubra TaxID=373956 RepID=A0AAN9AB19_HALRR
MGPDERMSLLRDSLHRKYGSTYQKAYYPEDSEAPVFISTTLTRFWVLFIFSLLSWIHCVLWNTWGPINESVTYAFPTWDSSTVAMTVNWTTIMFLVFIVPMCFAVQRCGLRNIMLLSTGLVSLGTALRCITMEVPWFTITCELCAVFVGIASTLILSGPSLIACDWFPQNERTTAIAVMMGASQLGGVGSYLEPLLVRLPPQVMIPNVVEDIKHDIKILLYIGAAGAGALLLATIVYFPSKPDIPPSVTSSTDRMSVYAGAKSLAKNKNFLLLLLAYGVSLGPPIGWVPLLDYSLLPLGFHQDHAMWVGLCAVIASSLFPVAFGQVVDRCRLNMRNCLVALMLLSTVCFYWFLLLSYGTIPVSNWQIYVSVVGGVTFNYTTIPIFFELAVEVVYPVPEILVSGILTAADNLTTTLFLLVFLIPDIGYLWITSTLVLCTSFTIIPLLMAKIDYKRTNLDFASQT